MRDGERGNGILRRGFHEDDNTFAILAKVLECRNYAIFGRGTDLSRILPSLYPA
jgi:hypothetical protein